MIKKFLGELRTGLIMMFRMPGPDWCTSWYWLDRYDEWREARTGRGLNHPGKITERRETECQHRKDQGQ